jgi:type IV pilus assembly protein PilY1
MLDSTGAFKDVSTDGIQTYASLDSNTFISDPVIVDYNLDYKTDAVYFGTVAGDFSTGWEGKLRRIVIKNNDNPKTWGGNSVLFNPANPPATPPHPGQSVVAAPTVTVDEQQNRWVFFGTGRFYNRLDVTNSSTATNQQSYYGIKENRTLNTSTGKYTWQWDKVKDSELVDVTGIIVKVDDPNGNFQKTVNDVESYKGWCFDFNTNTEKNLGQAALLGGLLTFTTYDPSNDPCTIEGSSILYALYYKSGTAYKKSVFGLMPALKRYTTI